MYLLWWFRYNLSYETESYNTESYETRIKNPDLSVQEKSTREYTKQIPSPSKQTNIKTCPKHTPASHINNNYLPRP